MNPTDGAEPVFEAPWQAQAFALTLALHERGVFTWTEWAEALARQIARADAQDAGYYEHWFDALEHLLVTHDVVGVDELRRGADPS